MAKKNQEPVKPVEPESESSEEDDTSSGYEEEAENPNKPPSVKTPQSDSSESDSDSEPEKATITNKTPQLDDAKKPKRPAQVLKSPDAKKPKTESVSKKPNMLFQRLFSDEDEIVILKGMIEFEANNNVSPTSDMDAFLNYIKKDLHVDVTKLQLQGKIRKLRNRYEKNKGKDKTSMKPHDKAALEFFEKLWGGSSSVVRKKANGKGIKKEKAGASDKKKDVPVENSNGGALRKVVVSKMCSSFGSTTEENLLRIGAELFGGGEEKTARSKEWKKLDREELDLSLKIYDVKRAKMKLVFDIME